MSAVGGLSGRTPDSSPAVIQAKQSLARAISEVDADRQAHSPGCVACDQKLADKAAADLAAAQSAASNSTLSIKV